MYQLIVLGYLNTYKMTYLLCGTKSEDLCWVVCKCSTSYEHRHSLRILHSLTLKTLELLQFSPFHMFTPHGKQNNEHQCFSDPFIKSILQPLTRPQIRGQWLLRQSLAHQGSMHYTASLREQLFFWLCIKRGFNIFAKFTKNLIIKE